MIIMMTLIMMMIVMMTMTMMTKKLVFLGEECTPMPFALAPT